MERLITGMDKWRRDMTRRLSPKLRIMLSALLSVVIVGVTVHVVQMVRWHIAVTDPAAPIIMPHRETPIGELITRLSDEDPDVRGSASGRLGDRGERAISPLMNVLCSDNPKARAAAAKALVDIGEPAVSALLEVLVEEDVSVATSAAWVLGEIGDPRAAEPLLREFEDHIAAAGSESNWSADPSRPSAASPRDKHEYAARVMAKALGQLRVTEAAYPLLMALGARDRHLDHTVASALEAMGKDVLPMLKENLWNVGPQARVVIINVSTHLEEPLPDEDLLRLLDSDKHIVSLAAARTLVRRGDARALPVLTAAIEEDWDTGASGPIKLLTELGDPRGVPAIIVALGHEQSSVRAQAARALGELGDSRAVEPLIVALKARETQVVGSAAMALAQIGDPRAFEPLVAAFKDGDHWTQSQFVKALGDLGDPRAVGPLTDALIEGTSGTAVSHALAALGTAAAPRLVELLAHETADDHREVFSALHEMKGDALEALLAGLDTASPEARESILLLLRYHRDDPRAQAAIDQAEAAAEADGDG